MSKRYQKTILESRLEKLYDNLQNYVQHNMFQNVYADGNRGYGLVIDTEYGKRMGVIYRLGFNWHLPDCSNTLYLFNYTIPSSNEPLKDLEDCSHFYNTIFSIYIDNHKININSSKEYDYLTSRDIDLALYEVERWVETPKSCNMVSFKDVREEYFQNQIII